MNAGRLDEKKQATVCTADITERQNLMRSSSASVNAESSGKQKVKNGETDNSKYEERILYIF